ncbi:MAG TPA: L,D-transpeptidase family protein [Candidatus Udaeobacter sp.]|nr:L,D-transpeptidase family protein [Candidatus Udaeobacter sp.]
MIASTPLGAERALDLARRALRRLPNPPATLPSRLLLVDVRRQRLTVIEEGIALGEYRVSTASAGIGGAEGSLKTPPGWHRIHARIGEAAPTGEIFESRIATGRTWTGEALDDDLILTRVITLEGLEEGVNRGPGVDSLERYIYLHGTNHEARLGMHDSHGCVRLANADVIELFDRVREGDRVVVVPEDDQSLPDPAGPGRFHYAGVGGSGMSALAQFQAMTGGRASGSDRGFDRGERPTARTQLERLGVRVLPQDGSGVDDSCAALVVSTAVEEKVPDVVAARAHGVPIIHRSELLAHFVAARRTIAIAGTSGKSTVVAMVFEILRGAGRDPSVITGGDLTSLQREGLWGNAWAGSSDLLVIEADESDGSLTRYSPAIGVALNLQRDHREMDEVLDMFASFRRRTRERFICGEDPRLIALGKDPMVFGIGPAAAVRGEGLELEPGASSFQALGQRFTLAVPGRHNIENALAAIAACAAVGVAPGAMAEPLAGFRGVGRRFQSLGRSRGVEVVDDFAHNPAKIAAAVDTAHRRARRVLAIYQPHGFGPTRFLRSALVDAFSTALAPDDRLWMLEIFYAGGTAQRDFSAADLVTEIAARGRGAEFCASRENLIARVASSARDGDLVLVMGARDPSLTELAKAILAALE